MRRAAMAAVVLAACGARAEEPSACPAGCAQTPAMAFTLRGGDQDSLRLDAFTPRMLLAPEGPGVEASVRAYGVDFGGAMIKGGPGRGLGDDTLNLGAAYDIGSVTVGGGVTMGLSGEDEAAGLGLDWRAGGGLTLGGALSIDAPDGAVASGAVSGGVSMRLAF